MDPSGDAEIRGSRLLRIACVAGACLLLLAAAFLPVTALLDFLSARFSTVRGFRSDYEKGFQVLRFALGVNGALLLLLPGLLRRCAFTSGAEAPPRRERFLPGCLLLAALAVSAPGLTSSFQDDEWRTMMEYVRHGPLVIFTRSTEADNHVLYSLLAWPFVSLFGAREWAVRMPAWILSATAPPLLYLLLRRSRERWISFLAALPMAGSSFLVQYAHEARGYGPMMAAVLGMCLLQPGLEAGSRKSWMAYVAVGTAAAFFHSFAAAAVVGLGLTVLLRREFRQDALFFRNLSAGLVIGSLVFLLYAPIFPQQMAYSALSRLENPPPMRMAELLSGGWVGDLGTAWAVPFGVAVGMGAFPGVHGRRALVSAGLTIVFLTVVMEVSGAPRSVRFYASALALMWIVVGHGLAAALARPARGAVLAAAVLGITLAADVDYYRKGKRDWKKAAAELRVRRRTGERLAVIFDARPMTPYLHEPLPVLTPDELMALRPEWHVGVDIVMSRRPKMKEWLEREYEVRFCLPSVRGEVRGYRRRSP